MSSVSSQSLINPTPWGDGLSRTTGEGTCGHWNTFIDCLKNRAFPYSEAFHYGLAPSIHGLFSVALKRLMPPDLMKSPSREELDALWTRHHGEWRDPSQI